MTVYFPQNVPLKRGNLRTLEMPFWPSVADFFSPDDDDAADP